ncbi:transcriptional regulator [Oceanobacillus sp. E9]|uniref:MerR family transcriptional regulator n=1 Tax=Oceanobacillus kimchii TaxID=746691 RepID=A0ABQ5TPJ8_9BACI|nr:MULTISPECIES: MerR family transcriptional regulator [Oceanobacillus]OEH56371.1 transcriptional regulator [Oceanobacillus sp. E9]GLO68077.1 MerR family transcriptional regulator [Oceanobacillus kimchii]
MSEQYDIEFVSKEVNISKSKLRYYEKHGLIKNIERDDQNNRIYNEKNIELIKLIACLRRLNVPISKIKQNIDVNNFNEESLEGILQEHKRVLREKVDEYTDYINEIDDKLERQLTSN